MTGSIRIALHTGELAAMALVGGAATLAAVVMYGLRSPVFLIAALIGGIGLVFGALRPLLALTIMVVIEVSNLSGVMQQYGSVPVFQASMLLGLLAVLLGLRDPRLRQRLNAWTLVLAALLAVFLATQVVAAMGSADMSISLSALRRIGIDLVFLMVIMLLAQMTARPWTVVATIVAVLAALSVLTVMSYILFGGITSFAGFATVTSSSGELVTTPRYGGPLPDSNFWGRHLVMGLPLAAALLTRALRSGNRTAVWAVALSILALFSGVYLTQSRGTFLSTGVAIAVWFIASERSVRRWGVASVPVVLAFLFVPGVGNRLQDTFQQIQQGQTDGHVDPSLLGRLAAQEQAAMMWEQRPYFGFGPGTFSSEVINFAGRVSTAVRQSIDAAHNLYLELLAQSGVFGLAGWIVMVAGFVAVLILRIIAQPRSPDRVLAAALVAAIIGWSVASIGLQLAYYRTFAIVMALVATVAPTWPVPAATIRTFVRGVGIRLAAVGVGAAFFWAYLVATSSSAYQATQHMTLVPAGPIEGWYAYALDIRSRIAMLPTMARVLRGEDSPVTVQGDPVRGLWTFTAKSESEIQARDAIQIAVSDAENRLRKVNGLDQYSLRVIGSMQIRKSSDHSAPTIVVGAGLGGVGGLATGLTLAAVTRRRRDEKPDSTAESPIDDRGSLEWAE